ncbi:MAG: UDP-N-acetylglucosamine 2-epimerase (non-hydrolyzing) [Myxococcota bacterium]
MVIGTRPEAIKLATVVQELKSRPHVRTEVCLTGQHDDLLQPVLQTFELEATHHLQARSDHEPSLAVLTARIVERFTHVLEAAKPDWVIVQGDTTSALAAALAAFYARRRIAHVEAGLRTGNLQSPWPEEGNRRMIGQIADLHFAPTMAARRALLAEGIDAQRIRVTGNTGIDALRFVARQIESDARVRSSLEDRFARAEGAGPMLLVTCHRRESQGRPLAQLVQALIEVLRVRRDVHVMWPVHPNPRVAGPVRALLEAAPDVRSRLHLLGPVDYRAFVYLMQRATCVITDSGGIQEEAPSLGLPTLVVRTSTERMEAVRAGAAILVGTERPSLVRHVLQLLDDPVHRAAMSEVRDVFGDGRASRRIVEALFTSPAKAGCGVGASGRVLETMG